MSCENCFDNCSDTLTSDKCVKYSGPDIECLDICTGDALYSVLQKLFVKTCENDIDTTILDIDLTCAFVSTLLGTNTKTTLNILQVLISGECSLKTLYDNLFAQVNAPFVLNTNCLTLPVNPTKDDVLKAVVTLLCTVSADVAAIKADYVKATQLNGLIATYLQSIGISTTPSSAIIQENTKLSKYIAYPYHGTLSVFDSNGNGLSSAGYDRVFQCLGQTIGTFTLPDYRGRSPMGINTGVSLTNIDNSVNPSLVPNANYLISLNTKKGDYTHTLNNLESAPHVHTASVKTVPNGRSATLIGAQTGGDWVTSPETITTNSSGGGDAHNNTHPSIGSCFIMYVPA